MRHWPYLTIPIIIHVLATFCYFLWVACYLFSHCSCVGYPQILPCYNSFSYFWPISCWHHIYYQLLSLFLWDFVIYSKCLISTHPIKKYIALSICGLLCNINLGIPMTCWNPHGNIVKQPRVKKTIWYAFDLV